MSDQQLGQHVISPNWKLPNGQQNAACNKWKDGVDGVDALSHTHLSQFLNKNNKYIPLPNPVRFCKLPSILRWDICNRLNIISLRHALPARIRKPPWVFSRATVARLKNLTALRPIRSVSAKPRRCLTGTLVFSWGYGPSGWHLQRHVQIKTVLRFREKSTPKCNTNCNKQHWQLSPKYTLNMFSVVRSVHYVQWLAAT